VTNLVQAVAASARNIAIRRGALPEQAVVLALDEAFERKQIGASDDLEAKLARDVASQLTGFGILQSLLDDPTIEEVWVNSPDRIFAAKDGANFLTSLCTTESEIRSIVERMLRTTGRRIDRSSPFVDSSLPDGSRLHVAIPDATKRHWSVNIRKFPERVYRLANLVSLGTLTPRQAEVLRAAMLERQSILVSGATQAGKTTLLCALLEELNESERLVTVEETFEIRTTVVDWVALQTRPEAVEGGGAVSLRRLIKEALRMRPSRLVVGEVREAESLDLLIALNSGLPGLCTIHANSAAGAVSKLCTLPLLAGQNIPSEFIRPTVAQVIDLVVHCELTPDGKRRVAEICSVEFDPIQRAVKTVALA